MAKGTYTVSGGTLGTSAPSTKVINLPFKPDYVQLINLTQAITPAEHGIPFAYWDASSTVTIAGTVYNPTIVNVFNATPVLTTDSCITNGISVFSAGQMLQYGASKQVIGITKAAAARVNVTAHGYSVGDTVVFQGIATGVTNNAFRLINDIQFTITAVSDADHFDIKWNSNQSSYTAIAASPAGALVKKVLYPFLYPPQDNVISAITTGTTTTVACTTYHNLRVGQEIAFRVPTFWGTYQLNSLPNSTTPGSPIYGFVTSITDNWTFVCNIDSSSYTAFTTNQTTIPSSVTPAQVLGIGDVNTGGDSITASSPLYPPPAYPTSSGGTGTINGPAIRGAFVNNTSQGFIIGAGASRTDTSSWVGGSDGDVMEWRAYLHDLSIP